MADKTTNLDKFKDSQKDAKKGDTFKLLGEPDEEFNSDDLPDEKLDEILADSDRPSPDANP